MKKLMILAALSLSLFSLNTFAEPKGCEIGGKPVSHGGSGCHEGFQASCYDGVISHTEDANGDVIPCGGIAAPGAAKPKVSTRKLIR